MAVWDDANELAKAIRDARGAATQKAVGAEFGINYKRWGRWEAAEPGTIGKTPAERKATALLAAAATGRWDLFGLSAPEPEEADRLRRDFEQKLVEAKNELRAEAAKELEALEVLLSSQGIAVPKAR